MADQQSQLQALQANFAFNLRLLDARDAELAALDAKIPAQEAKVASLKRAVVSLRTALARAEAGKDLSLFASLLSLLVLLENADVSGYSPAMAISSLSTSK